MNKEVTVTTKALYTFTLEEVLKALDLVYNRYNDNCISIGKNNQVTTVEILIENCAKEQTKV